MKRFFRFCLLAAVLLVILPACGKAMGFQPEDRTSSAPSPSNKFMSFLNVFGYDTPWECARMADHVPPLPPEADKIFQAARALEKRGDLTLREKGEVFNGYKKAAEMGHWKAMNNLIACYMSTLREGPGSLGAAHRHERAQRLVRPLPPLPGHLRGSGG